MIAYLTGQLHSHTSETCLLLVGGVGYEVLCSTSTLADIIEKTQVSLFIYTHVREDALQLYGFSTLAEKQMFLSLNKVSGIGPKSALQILSGSTVEEVSRLVEAEDVKALSKLPKVGKKTAEQMILTLKGKLVFEANDSAGKKSSLMQTPSVQGQIKSALINLGFRGVEVEKVVEGLAGLTFEEGLRQGLSALTHL